MTKQLPELIAGPILRHTTAHKVVWWLVTSKAQVIKPKLLNANNDALDIASTSVTQDSFCVGQHAYIHLISVEQKDLITEGELYSYDLLSEQGGSEDAQKSLLKHSPHLCHDGFDLPNFRFNKVLRKVAQGSCRKPHFNGKDALPQLDEQVKAELNSDAVQSNDHNLRRPDMMLMTGDQVYVDDVAGPMLHAIHQVIDLLGLHEESFEGATVANLQELKQHKHGFYQRELLLPEIEANDKLEKAFFAAKRKPVFTSVNARNHLIALSEMLAMYMLSWSANLWDFIELDKTDVDEEHREKYAEESKHIKAFTETLSQVQRAMAHVPNYMIFDDHDVTDDWNLTRGWEEQVYGHAFSKRIIGNAITAYFLCQGCGNPRTELAEMFEEFAKVFSTEKLAQQTSKNTDKSTKQCCEVKHQELIEYLFDFDQWHYQLDTSPPVHVLDTRTQRWRSESSLNKPSGLMDWEALCELQHNLKGCESVIMVSAAPVYGVKFIEMVQKIFTLFGGALIVDAENWMAHRGTASVMLNIFRHIKTPPNFIILSGDVHYSFVYDVKLRFRRNSPSITQFTSSGLHNQFPDGLLRWFDRLNRWFYGHRSPLNFLTKRRNMSVRQRQPEGQTGTLVNHSNIGVLSLNEDATQVDCAIICSDGQKVQFQRTKASKDS